MKPRGAVTRIDSKEKGRASVLPSGSTVAYAPTYHPIRLKRKVSRGFGGRARAAISCQ